MTNISTLVCESEAHENVFLYLYSELTMSNTEFY